MAEIAAIPQTDIIFVDDNLNGFSRAARQAFLELFHAMAASGLRAVDHPGHDQLRRR